MNNNNIQEDVNKNIREETRLDRTQMLIGIEAIEKLKNSKVIVFGVGGVGSSAVEALARGGVGHIALVDGDVVSITNINRQLVATMDTIGQYKTEIARKRIHSICPDIQVEEFPIFYTGENLNAIDLSKYDYIVDCIDMVTSKLLIIKLSKELNVNIISSMGTGNKLHPEKFKIADISKTSVCPLAKVIRKKLKEMRINKVKVLYSEELPLKQIPIDTHTTNLENNNQTKLPPASISFVPPVAGMIIAGEVIRDLIK